MTTDPLAPLLALADIAPAVEQARDRVDQAHRHRALRRQGGQVAAEVSLRSAVASAALEGRVHDREEVRAGTVTDPLLQGALRVAGALPGLSELWPKAPRQALARLHVLAARDVVPEAELGRPVADPVVATRLDGLAGLVAGGTKVPPLVLAAVVHGELLNLRPFPGPSGVVARAAARLVLISTGFDPRGLVAVDVGHREREPEYVGAAGAFATGTPDGLRSWLRHYMAAVEVGAEQITLIGDEILAAS
ncbi:oxidoreductase [Micromonospora terminaliae]|uniref:Oxidoreductase n=1 Tax=Micromonospora terminaliae TaxID=1914461 RepID=A0AAJ2ZC16_9ACTN|nr:oxidoreductase [Micromonospora terminaliae]NES26264.1 oxidoreductase [Micromonospora terminaliae]QGL50451.1 oxidoreductase [Micromonospora terminaliae]